MAAKTAAKNLCVEIPLPDGCLSMYVGEKLRANDKQIVLGKAAWIASTGRRHLFFAGTPDGNLEVEPYPDSVEISLPAAGAILTSWPHPLPRVAK